MKKIHSSICRTKGENSKIVEMVFSYKRCELGAVLSSVVLHVLHEGLDFHSDEPAAVLWRFAVDLDHLDVVASLCKVLCHGGHAGEVVAGQGVLVADLLNLVKIELKKVEKTSFMSDSPLST